MGESWWANPQAQRDRSVFRRVLEAELPRMTTDTSAAAKVDALVTAQWAIGFPKRGATRIQRAGQS